ncbi:activating signal cointegrator 1 complex subunit 1 [Drosophila bipectinata]|uniref:activating signal cointegrator 1 complex subunit 1 n=1 Tax=Drosophila bipectinata TaxID=42026 RepID=UPI001C899091|nr:activating signal cointegrator 1 complex subunit 1 [Drosophila bipectinata]
MSRNILAPPVQKMSHGRNYRVNVVHDDFGGSKWNGLGKKSKNEVKGYQEPDLYGDDDDEEDLAANDIVETSSGGYELALPVPKSFYGGLIGMKGNTKRRIEEEANCEIYVPRQNEKSNNVMIRARERSQVCAGLRRIRHITASLRQKMKPTHFLAVALNSGEVQEHFVELKKKILEANLPGIDEALFMPESSIHLTLGVYVLLDDDERKKALAELEACRPMLENLVTPFDLKIKGLEIMNDDPSATRVLYASVEAPELQKFADQVLAHLQTTGLCATDNLTRESVKLHMTVMNNRYRKEVMKCDDSFDAREILKRFGDYDFGSAKCQVLHLCVLKSRGEDDFYKITGSLEF